MSRFFPNAIISWLRELLRLDSSPSQQRKLKRYLDTGLQRLYVLQHLDGGWGWWEDDASQPYLTAYVIHGLLTVQKAGHSVDQQALEEGIGYLEAHLSDTRPPYIHSGELTSSVLDARAYALYVLAEAGQPQRGRTIALYDRRDKLETYGTAYLLMALDSLGDEERRVQTLAEELVSRARFDGSTAHWQDQASHAWTMSSDTRTTALVLQALVRADPDHPLVERTVHHLMQQRQNGHWRTTQESAVTLIALASYLEQSGALEDTYTYRARLDGRTLHEGQVSPDTQNSPVHVTLPLDDLNEHSQIAIQRHSSGGGEQQGTLYYSLNMRTYHDLASVQPRDEGIIIERDYIAVDPLTLVPTGEYLAEASLGQVVQVRLTLTVPQPAHYLAVEDMLPAGLEPLDASLKTVSSLVEEPEMNNTNGYRWWNATHAEIHDNRVALFGTYIAPGTYHYTYMARATTAGTFLVLPAKAYHMYQPEVYGHSAGRQLSISEE
jgi:hypothetical protein